MCGRFGFDIPKKSTWEYFDLAEAEEYPLRRDVRPTTPIAVILDKQGSRALKMMRWGLVPSWSKAESINKYTLINARAESAADKPSFRKAFKERRSLVPASCFYEWKKSGKAKLPHSFTLASGEPLALGGLWEFWQSSEGDSILSATIVTTAANEVMAPIHDRMPLILPRQAWDRWLAPEPLKSQDAAELLRPFPAQDLRVQPLPADYFKPGKQQQLSLL